ncbi:MAG TPA: DUF1178 family protein [Candidatus Binatia bacterium]|jgi:hypothetical protein
MVIYDLICDQNHRFEGWFSNFEGYQQQAAKGLISCPSCGTTAVEKLPHACAVHVKKESDSTAAEKTEARPPDLSETDMRELLIRLHQYVEKNFEDVGPRFAEEALAIFHGETEERPIHGSTTPEEREGLDEEGIPYGILPKPKLDS